MTVGVQASDVEANTNPDEDRHYMRSSSIVILDVGGEKFIALKRTLARFPTTRLGKLVRANTVRCPVLTHMFFSSSGQGALSTPS